MPVALLGSARAVSANSRASLLRTVCQVVLLIAVVSSSAEAQFKKRMAQLALCGVGGVAGYNLGDQVARYAQKNAKQMNMTPQQVAQYHRQIKIGTAGILCLGGAALAGTVYEKLSKRDMEARKREIELAAQEANPVTREYVMPDSKRSGTVTTEPSYVDGNKECKQVIDQLADTNAGDRAVVTYCRAKGGNGNYELEY